MRRTLLALASVAALAAGCAGSTPKAASSSASTTTSGPWVYERPACEPGAAQEITATPVAGSASDYDVTSFDDTVIRVHWFPVTDPGATVRPRSSRARAGASPAT